MAGELIRNQSEKLPVEGACPRLWCRPALSALASRGPASRHPFPAPSALSRKKDSFTSENEEKQGGGAKAGMARLNQGLISGKLIPTGTE